jgi:flagellar hook-length control protein FliK
MVDNQAQLQFLANHSSVRNAVEQAIPALREMLGEQGIALGDTSFSQQGNSQNFEQSEQPREQRTAASSRPGPALEEPTQSLASEPGNPQWDNGEINVYI